ncbi:hypothetical protein COCC4DRAFT_26984 [Bipolaris maydis ATCC 48331]|uniref:Uncharacterized protein n=2 Tax=Cochliobolus heterostrophus TaxID=5016 RepID=M2V924_COCH5|nr:uncharacterized protein COCC4DRAFT_26984 [Bipolaris maydis ATCC 48331]EMD96472.1 hypothetical protein COCHEDRAFT_1208402 [Bipolaris maydis C5]KAJ5031628.1 hypothetical protein J3E73DRAFT_364709 [Bipolaris maydis]ENI00999.1 hypothetical protein COCC4DRAFT_26984 [Bipolaris maydis ATCC 48331]KAJ5060322.1 hypothetical protein J3E74DRAFT_406679 [Bipolaris maydis]KAJ6201840.1 hypothetical protein J3E72DRAFT_370802 [Bipolaris maydis]
MASKLCCITEEGERSNSPELPNVRLSQLAPAKQRFLPEQTSSPNSQFTSARSGDLYELREIFQHAYHCHEDRDTPLQAGPARFSRPSVHSIRSLRKVKSMRSVIKKRFSKDFNKKAPSTPTPHSDANDITPKSTPDTVIKLQKRGPKQQLQIAKHDLRNNLLSDKKAHEGGYDSDAQVLDDVARNADKRSPNKRPSIHSVDWVASPRRRTTPESCTKGCASGGPEHDLRPYDIADTQAVSLSNRSNLVSSTPILALDTFDERRRRLKRSYSAESMSLPKPPPISPLRLPGLSSNDTTGKPWSEVMTESLQLSRFPFAPRDGSPTMFDTNLHVCRNAKHNQTHHRRRNSDSSVAPSCTYDIVTSSVAREVEIRVQQPTSTATPRPSMSIQGTLREMSSSDTVVRLERSLCEEADDDSHHSVHLQSMRISHHLRSGSLLSWDKLAGAPEVSGSPFELHEHTSADSNYFSEQNHQLPRHHRQTSSSGIASYKIPASWGNVVFSDANIRPDFASSVYSSRPQSPPGSFGGSMVNLSRTGTENQPFSISTSDLRRARRSASFPSDNEETPKPRQRHGLTNLKVSQSYRAETPPCTPPRAPLARNNSVADTKVSKFREEFSPPAAKKKLTHSSSIIRFLKPKRLSLRSQSEASNSPEQSIADMDGAFDTLDVPADRERRQSQSLVSLRAEQQALGKNKGANQVWDHALQAHQEEKASLFLPKNKDLAVQSSPFRERSGSVSTRRISVDDAEVSVRAEDSSRRLSTLNTPTPSGDDGDRPSTSIFRRRALASGDDSEVGKEVADAYNRQGDGVEVVGAWGRYPSHTREDRTGSAGKVDDVQPRDFALEAAIKSTAANDDEDLIDPTQRRPSTPLLPGEKKKKKKKLGSMRMARSSSMTFGRALMKNYSKMFKSQSTEFRRHGRGHRSSITSGGILEHPELELLPEVWAGDFVEENNTGGRDDREEFLTPDQTPMNTTKGKDKLVVDGTITMLRPRRNSSAPNLSKLSLQGGDANYDHSHDLARGWSIYYKNCVDNYPRPSTSAHTTTADFGPPARLSFDSRHLSLHSSIMRNHVGRQSRNPSPASRVSCNMRSGDDAASEKRSIVSVRRSTMDLISKFKLQEVAEHERMLGLRLGESG